MRRMATDSMTVKINPNDKANPVGRLWKESPGDWGNGLLGEMMKRGSPPRLSTDH